MKQTLGLPAFHDAGSRERHNNRRNLAGFVAFDLR